MYPLRAQKGKWGGPGEKMGVGGSRCAKGGGGERDWRKVGGSVIVPALGPEGEGRGPIRTAPPLFVLYGL